MLVIYLFLKEKQKGSLRVFTLEALWILLTLAEFFNIGIAADLKILLTLDVLLHLTPPMMNDVVDNLFSSNNTGFCYLV